MAHESSHVARRRLSVLVRFVLGALFWLVWYRIGLIAYTVGALVGLASGRLGLAVLGLIAFVTVGVVSGWLGSLLASRLRLDVPVWWAAPAAALATTVAVLVVARRPASAFEAERLVLGALELLVPVVLGQALRPVGQWRRSRKEGALVRDA